MALLTNARRAIWSAIDNWPDLAGAFNLKLRFDSVGADQDDGALSGGMLTDTLEPSLSDLPAISVIPTTVDPSWWTHEMMTFLASYQVVIWTRDWYLPDAEDLIEKTWKAIWQAAASDSSAGYVKVATGYHPKRIGPIQWQMASVGRDRSLRATRVQMTLGLRTQQDPTV